MYAIVIIGISILMAYSTINAFLSWVKKEDKRGIWISGVFFIWLLICLFFWTGR